MVAAGRAGTLQLASIDHLRRRHPHRDRRPPGGAGARLARGDLARGAAAGAACRSPCRPARAASAAVGVAVGRASPVNRLRHRPGPRAADDPTGPLSLLLASTSARPIDLLTRSGIAFRAIAPGIDERPPVPLGPLRFVAWAARAKAEAVAAKAAGRVVVGAHPAGVPPGPGFWKAQGGAAGARLLRAPSGQDP